MSTPITKQEQLYFLRDAKALLESVRVEAIKLDAIVQEAENQQRKSEAGPTWSEYSKPSLRELRRQLQAIPETLRELNWQIDNIENPPAPPRESGRRGEWCEGAKDCTALVVTEPDAPFALCAIHQRQESEATR